MTNQPPLWICDTHEMIGSKEEAERHAAANNCMVTELAQEPSDAIRALWEQQRLERTVGFIQLARLKDRTRW
jgi:hypothetical protein